MCDAVYSDNYGEMPDGWERVKLYSTRWEDREFDVCDGCISKRYGELNHRITRCQVKTKNVFRWLFSKQPAPRGEEK